MKPALIFDLDGTLWDATVPITESWLIVGRKYFGPGYQLDVETVKGLMGKTMKEIADCLTPKDARYEDIAPFVEECFRYEREYLVDHPGALFPNELDVLIALSRTYVLYIVSNCQAGYIENFTKLVPEGLFLGHRCWSDTKKEKQFTIRRLMEDYGIREACYIGDTDKDESASHLAGIPFVFASYGFGESFKPEAIATSFEDLPRAIAQLPLHAS